MDEIKIEISGVKLVPSWTTLQTMLSEALQGEWQITKIERMDNEIDYRQLGDYDLTAVNGGFYKRIKMTVKG